MGSISDTGQLSPMPTEARMPRAHAPQEKSPQWAACAPQLESKPAKYLGTCCMSNLLSPGVFITKSEKITRVLPTSNVTVEDRESTLIILIYKIEVTIALLS